LSALLDEAEWFTEARGEINTVVYGAALETRKLVPIKGVGESSAAFITSPM